MEDWPLVVNEDGHVEAPGCRHSWHLWTVEKVGVWAPCHRIGREGSHGYQGCGYSADYFKACGMLSCAGTLAVFPELPLAKSDFLTPEGYSRIG